MLDMERKITVMCLKMAGWWGEEEKGHWIFESMQVHATEFEKFE